MRKKSKNDLQDNLIPVRGVVHSATEVGVFLDVQPRRVFVPADHTLSALRRLRPGEVVTLQIYRSYALQKGLAGATTVSRVPPTSERPATEPTSADQ